MRLILALLLIASPVLAENSPKKPIDNSRKPTQPLPECVKTDCDCNDFKNQQEAQRVLDAFPNDPHRLDRDRDGIACEAPKK